MHPRARYAALVFVMVGGTLLSGCMMAAHSVLAPMLDAGIKSAVERNATPESMGVSTAQYRGKDCAYLKSLAENLTIEKTLPQNQGVVGKSLGWNVDAINQVRAEQGCDTPVQARLAGSTQVPMFGFCWYTETTKFKHYVSASFQYADWYADHGKRESEQFNALLRSRYGESAAAAVCQFEDSQLKLDAARQKTLAVYRTHIHVSTTSVSWTPVPAPPRPTLLASNPALGSSRVASVAMTPAQGAFRVTFDTVTPEFARSLGMDAAGGALVVEIEKGSTAERAGLKPLDVIVEVGGQGVHSPADLQAIVGRMRPGYKAAVRVWRHKAMRDMVVEVAVPISAP